MQQYKSRVCQKCSIRKSIEDFPLYSTKKVQNRRRWSCRKCHYSQNKYYSLSSEERTKINNKFYELEIKMKPINWYFSCTKRRAKRQKIKFNLTLNDFKNIPTHCPILGYEMKIRNKNRLHSLSIDRIDNSKGYIKGNIAFISYKANMCKSNLTFEQIERLYLFYKNLQDKS